MLPVATMPVLGQC